MASGSRTRKPAIGPGDADVEERPPGPGQGHPDERAQCADDREGRSGHEDRERRSESGNIDTRSSARTRERRESGARHAEPEAAKQRGGRATIDPPCADRRDVVQEEAGAGQRHRDEREDEQQQVNPGARADARPRASPGRAAGRDPGVVDPRTSASAWARWTGRATHRRRWGVTEAWTRAGICSAADVLEFLAGLEPDGAARRDAHFLARSGVAADAALAGLHLEDAEPAQFDPFAALHRFAHRLEDGLDGDLGPHLGDVGDSRDTSLMMSTLIIVSR